VWSLYKALPPRLLSVMPMIGIQFAVYELMKRLLLHQPPPLQQLVHEKIFIQKKNVAALEKPKKPSKNTGIPIAKPAGSAISNNSQKSK
jgi:hypothetical protein